MANAKELVMEKLKAGGMPTKLELDAAIRQHVKDREALDRCFDTIVDSLHAFHAEEARYNEDEGLLRMLHLSEHVNRVSGYNVRIEPVGK